MPRRPWNSIPIEPRRDPLVPLPPDLLRLEPHPYTALGAPYGPGGSPFQLRQEVIDRLLDSQEALQEQQPDWRLAIFDGWRPLAVQAFMVEHTVLELCRKRGVDPAETSSAREAVTAEVGRFWASPDPDPATPPPHSTGAAVDLTIVDHRGLPLDMGSAIDAIGAVSYPDHFEAVAQEAAEPAQRTWARGCHRRRRLLRQVLQQAGFAQHPNEWWHFSWGDQLWAWSRGEAQACYGRVEPEPG